MFFGIFIQRILKNSCPKIGVIKVGFLGKLFVTSQRSVQPKSELKRKQIEIRVRCFVVKRRKTVVYTTSM